MMGMLRAIQNSVEKLCRSDKEINGNPMLIAKIAFNINS
jgi:hypothetical protein